jgi:hypothetical protein
MSIELNAIVLERIEVSPGLIILRVVPGGWELPEFDAGQFAVLRLPGAAPRCDLAMTEESKPDPSHQTGLLDCFICRCEEACGVLPCGQRYSVRKLW